jgi:hypothetical protein
MLLGLSLSAFTKLHVIISLIAIAAGVVALVAFARGRWLARTTHVFLATTLLTTVTGFLFPFKGFTPALGVGIVSTAVLAVAFWALYAAKLQGRARAVYAITAVLSLYFNFFVLVVQGFLKIPALHEMAPNGNEPPFAIAQGVVLLACLVLGFLGSRSGRQQTAPPLPA